MLLILIILDCIMNLNIKVEQQSIKSSISQLSQYLSNKLQFLKIFSQSIAKLSLNRYPIKQCIQVWTHLAESIMQRCKLYEQTGCRVLVLSTAFFWMIPKLVTFYQQLWKYIKDYCEGKQGGHIDFQRLKEVIDVINQKNQYSFGADRIDQILKIPLFCLQEIVIRITVITSLLENKLRKKENENGMEVNKTYMRKMEIMWSQFQNLHKAIDQINKIMIIFTQKEDNNQCQKYKICLQKTNIVMDQYASIGADKVRFIKRYIHRLKLIKHWKNLSMKRKNRLKDRKISILQLINGENNYLKGLQEYIKYIKQPIQMKKILDGNQLRLLFSSIMQIKILHERIYKQLKNYFDEYNDQQCYAPIIAQLIPSFKKYTQYVLNAQAAQTYMKQLITNNLIVAQIGRQYTLKTKKQAQNELLQPTFRIARYQALFHQIIKRTPTSHRDFKLFLDVQASFKDVLTEVNNAVDKIIRNSKLQQLDREFGTHDSRIFNNNRQYLTEFSVSLIREYLQDVILYICNDMIIMVEQNTRKKLRIIPINEDFFARREEDNKIFKNMVTIHSDGLMTFTVGLQQIYANKAEQLGNLLKSLMTQSLKLVQVSVLGTEQIGSTSFSKYTEYILQVKYLDVKKLLHMRFRNIEKLSWEMQKYYNNSLKIEGENLRKSWFNSHTSQTIESRKMKIVQIFQKLFNNEIIRKNPSFFLKSISFPENFFEAARNSYQKRVSLSQTVTISRLKRSYLSRQQKKQAFTILCAAEIVLGRQLFYDNESNQKLKKLKDQAKRIEIRVNTLDEEQVLAINITEYDTVEDVCNRISRIKGLRWNRDFRLFHEIGKKQLRVLEHEQILTKIFQFPKSQQSPILIGIYDKFKSSFSKIFAQAYPTLIFKKYLYLPYEIELPEMRKDLVRMRMTTCQVFSQIQDTKYELSYDEYLLFLAMYIYIHLDGDIVRLEEIDSDVVHKVIPERVFKLKDQTEKVWIEKSRRYLPRIYEQIQKIREHNQKQLQQGRKIIDTVSKSSLYFGRKFLCSQLLLNKISKNHIFGSNIFYVQLHRTCFNQLQQRKLKVAYNMWLAISLKSIKLLSQSSKQAVFQLKYEDLGKPLVYAAGIVFKTSGAIQELYRFNTYQSLEISQLFKYNKALSEILNNLDVDKDLNMRVKKYRDDLLFHKETFSSSQVDLSCLR